MSMFYVLCYTAYCVNLTMSRINIICKLFYKLI